jgi:hypothetical protein
MSTHTNADLLSLVPLAVLNVSGLVKHYPHGSLHLDQLLAVLGKPGIVDAGVGEGGGKLRPCLPQDRRWCLRVPAGRRLILLP